MMLDNVKFFGLIDENIKVQSTVFFKEIQLQVESILQIPTHVSHLYNRYLKWLDKLVAFYHLKKLILSIQRFLDYI